LLEKDGSFSDNLLKYAGFHLAKFYHIEQ